MSNDFTVRFGFDATPVRGRMLRLENTWQAMCARQETHGAAVGLLADLAVAAGLLGQDLKVDGSLSIQLHAGGREARITTAMAECRGRSEIRGIVRGDPAVTGEPDLAALFGGGQLAITLMPEQGAPYQGRIELGRGNLAHHLEAYFDRSEQLPTRIFLARDRHRAAGLMLQRVPGAVGVSADDDDWRRLTLLAQTLSATELLTLAPPVLLRRLYGQDRVRLQRAEPLAFGCSCTRERSANALSLMSRAEIGAIIDALGSIDVTCEFCGANYRFDAVDAHAAALASRSANAEPEGTIH